MRSAIDMMQRNVWVPIKFGDKLVKAPFVLFNDWTLEERQMYHDGLGELKERLSRSGGCLCYLADGTAIGNMVHAFFSKALGTGSLAEVVGRAGIPKFYVDTDYSIKDRNTEFRHLWIDMQRAMISVPKFNF